MEKTVECSPYILYYSDKKKGFGYVSASHSVIDNFTTAKIMIRAGDVLRINDNDGLLEIDMSVEQLLSLSEVCRSVAENIELLQILNEQGRLRDRQ